MAISTTIPESWKLPLFWAVVDGSQAGNLSQNQAAMLVGQSLPTGTAQQNVPLVVASPALADVMFGQGSMLARMCKAFFKVNPTQLLYAIAVPDPAAGVAAAGGITIATAPTAAGILSIYIAGQLVQIVVAATDTTTSIATNLAAQINAQADLPVTATAALGVVTLTCKWKGLTGNDITIIPNYLGSNGGQALPQGVTLTIAAMANGAGEPDFTAAIASIQTMAIYYAGVPYTDSASMAEWANEFGFNAGGRWSYERQQYGFIVNYYRTDYADLITWGLAQNQPVISTMALEPQAPTPVWEYTAAYCAAAALGFSDDPARPLQTLELVGCLPAPVQNQFMQAQLNNLANSGFAIQGVAPDGNPMILREQTQYQKNSYGQGDTAFALLTTLATLAALLQRMSAAITTKYPRVKLVPDGTPIGPGQAVISPSIAKAELVSEYNAAMYDGLCSNLPAFIANLTVEIDNNNSNRLNVLWPPQLAGQLRQFAVLAQFRLLYPPTTSG
mgnify:CR=1 FL=1